MLETYLFLLLVLLPIRETFSTADDASQARSEASATKTKEMEGVFSSQGSSNPSSQVLTSTQINEEEDLVGALIGGSQPISEIGYPVDHQTKKRKLRFSKSDVLDLLISLRSPLETIRCIFNSLAEVPIENLDENEIDDLDNQVKTYAKKLGKLDRDFKARKFRYNPDTLETTFLKVDDVPEYLKEVENVNSLEVEDANSLEVEDVNRSEVEDVSSLEVEDVNSLESDIEEDDVPVQDVKTKRSYYKPLNKLKDKNNRDDRIKEDFEYLIDSAVRNKVDFSVLVGHLLHRYYYNSNKHLAKLGDELFKENTRISIKPTMNIEMALHILERYKFGKSSYINLRILVQDLVKMPPYTEVSHHKSLLTPKFIPYLDETGTDPIGVVGNIKECIVKHLLRLIQSSNSTWLLQKSNFSAKVVFGMDSRGDEKEHAQRSQVHLDTSHAQSVYYTIPAIYRSTVGHEEIPAEMRLGPEESGQDLAEPPAIHKEALIVHPVVSRPVGEGDTERVDLVDIEKIGMPLDFQLMDGKVWSDPHPASHRAVRNVAIIMEKENRENVDRLVKTWLENEIKSLKTFSLGNKREVKDLKKPILIVAIPPDDPTDPSSQCILKAISVDVHFKGCDMKMTQILTGIKIVLYDFVLYLGLRLICKTKTISKYHSLFFYEAFIYDN